MSEPDTINRNIREIHDVQTEEWGIEETVVELPDIRLPASMQRAMAHQAEAERAKRAKIIAAQGEALAAGHGEDEARTLARSRPAARWGAGLSRGVSGT